MLAAACTWIEGQLDRFTADRRDGSPGHLASIKALGDLAHGADVLARSPVPELAERGRIWLELAAHRLAGGERIRELIAASPMYAPAAVAYLALELAGRRNPALTATLAAAVTRAQLPPLAWTMLVPTLELLGIAPSAAMHRDARRMSVLASRTPADAMPADAAYVLAHECLYATRWGRDQPRWDDETAGYVAVALPALIERATSARDVDLLAELIAAGHAALGTCVAPQAWQTLAAAQTPAGNLEPAPLVTMFPRLAHPALGRTYHTTLVAIMAAAGCRHAPP